MGFLRASGIVAENYHSTYENNWEARSPYIKTSDDRTKKNSVKYYVNGNSSLALTLELHLNVSSLDSLKESHSQLYIYAKELINQALDRDMPHEIGLAILEGLDCEVIVGHYKVTLIVQERVNKSLGVMILNSLSNLWRLQSNYSAFNGNFLTLCLQ